MGFIGRVSCSIRRWRSCERGTSALEFAILAPVYMLAVFGMIGYGVFLGASHSIQQISADAVRAAIAGLDGTERQTLARNFIAANAANYAFIDTSKLTVDVHDSAVDPNQLVVALTYDASGLPIWQLLPDLPLPGKLIVRRSTIRMGGL